MTTLILVCISLASLEPKTIQVKPEVAAAIVAQQGEDVAQSKRIALKECRKHFPETELAYLNRN